MPHIVLEGPVSIEEVWMAFKPLSFREGGTVLKAEMAYLREDKRQLLVRALTVERGFTKEFFMRLTQRENAMTLDLEPMTAPERSDGVKRLMGLCAWVITETDSRMMIGDTDMPDFVGAPSPGG